MPLQAGVGAGRVDRAEGGVAVPDGLHLDPDADEVVDLIELAALHDHLLVDAPQVLRSAGHLGRDVHLGKARAQLAKDQATLADARRQLERSRDLLARNFVSPSAVDTAQANVDAQQAAVQADQAAIDAVRAALPGGPRRRRTLAGGTGAAAVARAAAAALWRGYRALALHCRKLRDRR